MSATATDARLVQRREPGLGADRSSDFFLAYRPSAEAARGYLASEVARSQAVAAGGRQRPLRGDLHSARADIVVARSRFARFRSAVQQRAGRRDAPRSP